MPFADNYRRPRLLSVAIILAFILSLVIVSTRTFGSSVSTRLSPFLGGSRTATTTTGSGSHYSAKHDRPLILYAYHESPHARENLPFFLDQGLHSNADFVFIFNGASDLVGLVPTNRSNIRVVQRDNTCFDLGAFGEVLKHDGLWRRYRRFITLNASLRGPFTPFWSKQCWSDVYLDELDDQTKVSVISGEYSLSLCCPSNKTGRG